MNRPFSPRDLITAAAVLAAALLVPQLFHSVQNAGSIFLTMHIPLLVGGFSRVFRQLWWWESWPRFSSVRSPECRPIPSPG